MSIFKIVIVILLIIFLVIVLSFLYYRKNRIRDKRKSQSCHQYQNKVPIKGTIPSSFSTYRPLPEWDDEFVDKINKYENQSLINAAYDVLLDDNNICDYLGRKSNNKGYLLTKKERIFVFEKKYQKYPLTSAELGHLRRIICSAAKIKAEYRRKQRIYGI